MAGRKKKTIPKTSRKKDLFGTQDLNGIFV
jgi:hypothetical protein